MTVLGSYVFSFKKKRTVLTVSFKLVWLNLFLYTADIIPGFYTETKPCGLPLQCMNTHNL